MLSSTTVISERKESNVFYSLTKMLSIVDIKINFIEDKVEGVDHMLVKIQSGAANFGLMFL